MRGAFLKVTVFHDYPVVNNDKYNRFVSIDVSVATVSGIKKNKNCTKNDE